MRASDIRAPVTGSVWKIACNVGDTVAPHTVLVVLESMKLEFPIETEREGVVKAIHCSEGQSVAEGEVLVEFE